LLPFEEPLVPFEAPLAGPLPLAAGSGSHEGHMLVGVSSSGVVGLGKERLEVRAIQRAAGDLFNFDGGGFGK